MTKSIREFINDITEHIGCELYDVKYENRDSYRYGFMNYTNDTGDVRVMIRFRNMNAIKPTHMKLHAHIQQDVRPYNDMCSLDVTDEINWMLSDNPEVKRVYYCCILDDETAIFQRDTKKAVKWNDIEPLPEKWNHSPLGNNLIGQWIKEPLKK